MAHTETRAVNRASNPRLLGAALKTTAAMILDFRGWRQSAARRRAFADLTADQLKDIGCSDAPRPKLVVRAGLITNLMSMR